MTLRSRNRLLHIFSYTSALLFVLSLALFVALFFRNQEPAHFFEISIAKNHFSQPFFQSSFFASILSLFILLLYLPLTGFFLLRNFEKTQAAELIYFTLFLTGIFLQSLRIFVPLFNLYEGYRSILILLSRTFFSGQLLSVLSLWFIPFYSLEDPLQQADKNALIIIVVAVILSFFMPINTQILEASFIYKIGFPQLFSVLKYSLISITAIALVIRGKEHYETKIFLFAFSYLLLIIGSIILGSADSYALCILGALLLSVGNSFFLKTLHAYYLWK